MKSFVSKIRRSLTGEEEEAAPVTRAARRLSLVVDDVGGATRNSTTAAPRRASLTPLAYFDQADAVEQFIEPEQVAASDVVPKPGNPSAPSVDVLRENSAENFRLPRNSIAAGIKIEITPPSSFKENNEYIEESVVVEVPDDIGIPNSAKSKKEVPAPTSANSKKEQSDLKKSSSKTSVKNATSTDAPPPGRRRTKLLEVKLRRQTISAIPKPPKTVRFESNPSKADIKFVNDDEADRTPFLWNNNHFENPDQIEAESGEPLQTGLLSAADFSDTELGQIKKGKKKFVEERKEIRKFFETRLTNHRRPPVPKMDDGGLEGGASRSNTKLK